MYVGVEGLRALDAAGQGTPTVAGGTLNVAERTFTASIVLAGSSVPGIDRDAVRRQRHQARWQLPYRPRCHDRAERPARPLPRRRCRRESVPTPRSSVTATARRISASTQSRSASASRFAARQDGAPTDGRQCAADPVRRDTGIGAHAPDQPLGHRQLDGQRANRHHPAQHRSPPRRKSSTSPARA